MSFNDTKHETNFSIDSLTANITLISLDELLNSIGLTIWMSRVTTFVLPIVNFLGFVGCSLSAWIFFRKKFVDPIFFYYRLLCVINIIHLLHNITACVLYSPRYFPSANTWAIASFKIYYAFSTIFLFHYSEVLQMGILLARMKIYSPFVKKHFKASPHFISLALFILCILIDSPIPFAFKIIRYGDYYYYCLQLKHLKKFVFYYYAGSDFSETKVGKILLGIFCLIINMLCSLVAGVTLNIVSYLKYKVYVADRKAKDEEIQIKTKVKEKNFQPCSRKKNEKNVDQEGHLKILSQKALNELNAEKNMFHMIITLSLISIVSRVIVISCNLYGLLFFSQSQIWALVVIDYFVYALVPTISIFIFYAFNKLFRKEFKKIFESKKFGQSYTSKT